MFSVLEKQFIAASGHSNHSHVYRVNPYLFFNSDGIIFIIEYKKYQK
ncbi:hypothetical protein XNW1_430024 [Xenorhabdus nematophila str. Websteri]|nr:hypothetical protein XNA1_2330034 [Xenorhabdus nematophila str. Anatoliense]CEE95571.1 hypothetical protein XNA1_550034 [Xenorhabdus nematophila str. Anatoliense]CEF32241.1 hypothetical protein XNW1_4280024 [Xenorhabdus nematophila str. Websteri]CEF32359.1 hypothetical protein XNW1_430024 [Xenorhabdus nematophila str. Websteri]